MFAYLIVFIIAFATALLLVPVVGAVASRLGVMDEAGELSIHSRPVPRVGGVAIFAGFLIATTYAWWNGILASESSAQLLGVLIGGVCIALAGLLDDVRRISPLSKLLWQFLAASVAIGLGVQTRFLPLIGIDLALTLFYFVGSANAVNLLDGMDGLAAGVSIIAAFSFALIAASMGNGFIIVLMLALAGAVLGFLPFNFPRARIFMGDVGSLFLGFALASSAVLLTDEPYNLLRLVVPLVVLGVPVFDTVLALSRRFRRLDDLFSGDRDHTYDILARRWGNLPAVAATWGGAAFVGGVAVVAARLGGWLGGGLVMLAAGIILWLAQVSGVLAPLTSVETGKRAGQSLTRLLRRYMHPVLLDLGVIVLSFYLALILRFSGVQSSDVAQMSRYAGMLTEQIFFIAFVFAISASLFGLYNRIWRYGSGRDTVAILGAGGVGTLAILIVDVLWGNARPIPISVVLVGGLLTTVGFMALRHRQRLVDEVLRWRGERETAQQRVLIVGAGEEGQHLARQMQRYYGRYWLVGFVDDDPEKRGLQVHGVRVLGTISDVPDLVDRHQASMVVIAMPGVARDRLNEIFDVCQKSSARIQILPNVMEQLDTTDGRVKLRDLVIDDLLGRPPREVDEVACRTLIAGKVVLVTGAAGSIGSELCRQIGRYGPIQLLALDQNETGLYDLGLDLQENDYPCTLVMGDVSDSRRMEAIWRKYCPAVVFHCAAY
ncbi:MAG: polysaccharide biosynthesis protein, partial [Anaerolineae bacterium]